jgi:hypothetical protein
MKGRVIILMHCTPPSEIYIPMKFHVDISKILSYALDKNYVWKIAKGNYWNFMQSRVCAALLLNMIYPAMKFQVDTSEKCGTEERTEGHTDGDYFYTPSRLFGGG